MIEGLYEPFQHWGASGTTWILSDTHFNDPDLIHAYADRPSAEEQVKLINAKCGRADTPPQCMPILLLAFMFISIFSSFKPNTVDDGIVFPEDRELFIPVDKGEVLGGDAYAVADRNTGVVYIYTNGALSPLYDKEGNLIIYER